MFMGNLGVSMDNFNVDPNARFSLAKNYPPTPYEVKHLLIVAIVR
jgi:hypothetical protein